MKILIGGLAAAFMATAALAQTPPATSGPDSAMTPPSSTTMGPMDPATSAPATSSPMTPGPSSTMTPSGPDTSSMSSSGAANATAATEPALTKKNGKWYNGDRRATKDEIAQYQQANPK